MMPKALREGDPPSAPIKPHAPREGATLLHFSGWVKLILVWGPTGLLGVLLSLLNR